MKLCTSEQMRALEQAAVEAGTPLDELMEQAGLAVAQEVWLNLGVVAGRRVLVLVGPGNNGGDGLVAARLLRQAGFQVDVFLAATEAKLGEASRQMLAKARFAGIEPVFYGGKGWAELEDKAERKKARRVDLADRR